MRAKASPTGLVFVRLCAIVNLSNRTTEVLWELNNFTLNLKYLKYLLCVWLSVLCIAFTATTLATAVFSPEPWLDASGTDLAIVGGNSALQINPQYESIKDMILRLSREYEISPTLSWNIVKCESGGDPTKVGDRGMSRGLWQINQKHHPYITDKQAFDPEWSTRWSLEKIKQGKDLWTCWK